MVKHPSDFDDPVRWGLIKKKANEARAARAFALFRARRIEPILIKGVAAGIYYPPSRFRDAIDLDLAVSPAEFDSAAELIESPEAANLGIDLHRGMRHLDGLEWGDLFARSELAEIADTSIRVLCREDHLRILAVHWLTDGGGNEQRLWDITYGLQGRSRDFDWERFLEAVGTRRRRWVECVVGMCQRVHSLDLTATPLAEAEKKLPAWFVDAVEREWAADTPFVPLRDSLTSITIFWKQLRKRLPPSPITATVLLNGDIDAPVQLHYQLASVAMRLGPSLIDVVRAMVSRVKRRGHNR